MGREVFCALCAFVGTCDDILFIRGEIMEIISGSFDMISGFDRSDDKILESPKGDAAGASSFWP